MVFLLGFLPIYLMSSAVVVAMLSFITKNRAIYVAFSAASSLVAFIVSLYILSLTIGSSILVYRYGGFPAPLGIVYTVDKLSGFLATLSMFMLLLTSIYSSWMIRSRWLYLYYLLLFLMATGSIGCLYTGDIFNFFVSLELLAISSYALTAFYRDSPRAIRAALRYAISGMIVTSLYLLSTFIIYGSFGTLNMADIALKARNPSIPVAFTGTAFGDVVISSKVAVALITWVFLFKSAIFPLNFAWQPYAYSEAPTPVAAAFTAISDTVGLYGLIRFFYTLFGYDSIIGDFRTSILQLLQIIAISSAFVGALLMSFQRDVKRFIAFSTMVHLSFALLGISLGNVEGIASALLHILSNTLGDSILFYLAGISIVNCGRRLECLGTLKLWRISIIAFGGGVLNLFGVLPVFIGFWGKALLVLSSIRLGTVVYAVLTLFISGVTAIGYFRVLHQISISKANADQLTVRDVTIPHTLALTLLVVTIVLGMGFSLYRPLMDFVLSIGFEVMNDYSIYIARTLTGNLGQ